jgi:CubicO group peptidase (beta-lactamase class C family)
VKIQPDNRATSNLSDSDLPKMSEIDARLIDALKETIPHVMRQNGVPGLNIALARRGEVIWKTGFGYADLDQKTPMTAETVLHSGSMGKVYTATAVMQLVESGVIGLHDPINKYLNEFQVINPLGEREITFYDLLTHRSGLTTNMAGPDFAAPKPLGEHLKEGYTRKTFKAYQGSLLPLWSAKVGEKPQYSNLGMATLGYLVEVANPEALSFSEYVQQHIMDPLGMASSQYPPVQDDHHVREDIFGRYSSGYAYFGPVHLPTPTMYFADYPAGTVVTTPGDHIRLFLAYLNEGAYNGYRLLKPETVRLMLTPQAPSPHEGMAEAKMGLTWFLLNPGSEEFTFTHSGAHMWGWTNVALACPGLDFALVVAVNHWPMLSDAERYAAGQAIALFIASWLKRVKRGALNAPPKRSWAWKCSYVIGLVMVERTMGGLGIPSPLTDEMIDAMAEGAKVRAEAETGEPVWDPEGFRTGVKDMLSVEMTPPAIQAFLESERLQVLYEELPLLYRELGVKEDALLPWLKSPGG